MVLLQTTPLLLFMLAGHIVLYMMIRKALYSVFPDHKTQIVPTSEFDSLLSRPELKPKICICTHNSVYVLIYINIYRLYYSSLQLAQWQELGVVIKPWTSQLCPERVLSPVHVQFRQLQIHQIRIPVR